MASPVGTLDVIARRAERAPLATRMWKGSISFMRRKPLGAAGAVIILVMVILALAAPLIAGDPTAWSLRENFQGSSWKYWLGTNDVGQDLWAQIVNGARISLYVGILSVAFGLWQRRVDRTDECLLRWEGGHCYPAPDGRCYVHSYVDSRSGHHGFLGRFGEQRCIGHWNSPDT